MRSATAGGAAETFLSSHKPLFQIQTIQTNPVNSQIFKTTHTPHLTHTATADKGVNVSESLLTMKHEYSNSDD